ncbi:MAG: TCR/Tet family MFS transporter [Labrys sp. (in: a-proteobacteria)]|jgi:DHA1 family tetracycline resistance protein-like MFS transporter
MDQSQPAAVTVTPARSPHAVLFIFITVVIDMIGLGLIIPVLPEMIRSLSGTDLADAATIGGWLFFTYGAMQFLCGPLMGNLSDAFGRRRVLLLSVAGLGVDYLLTALAPTLLWLFIGRALAGFFGASYTTANAYIADVTTPKERGKAFGMIGAAWGIGFVLGPAIGGLLGEFGPRVPFFVAAGLSLVNLAYGYFVLPETLPPERRRPFDLRRANPLGTLMALRRVPGVGRLALVVFVFAIGHSVYPAVWAYFTMYRFGWSEAMVGASLAFFGVMTAIVQGGLTGTIIKRFGERRAAMLGLTASVLALTGFGAAQAGWVMFAMMVVGCIEGVVMPAVNAMMSQRVPPNAQGELQGGISSLQNIASVTGILAMSQIFGLFASPAAPIHAPGMPFFVAAVMTATALAILVTSVRARRPAEA